MPQFAPAAFAQTAQGDVVLSALLQAAAAKPSFTSRLRSVNTMVSTSFLADVINNNPRANVALGKVMGGEVGVLLPAVLGALHAGAAQSARGIADDMNFVMRGLLTAPPVAQQNALIRAVGNLADAFAALKFGGITVPTPVRQSSARPAAAVVTPQLTRIPGIAIAYAEDHPSSKTSDPFLKELEKLYDDLFAPVSIFGIPIVIPAGQPTKAASYLKKVEEQTNESLRRMELGLSLQLGKLVYDIKNSVLECTYTPLDTDKKIKRFIVDNFVKPALNDLRIKEERELDIYNADSRYGGMKTWSEEEQEALRENQQGGGTRSSDEVIEQVAQDRIARAARFRQANSYGPNDTGGGFTYVRRVGRMKEDAALSGREIGSLIGGDSDVSLAAYAKIITKYIAEDTLELWANSPGMSISSVFNDVRDRVIQRFLATQVINTAEKRKIIEDAANAAMKQFNLTLTDALKNGDEAIAAYSNILNVIGSFASTYCKHKKEIDGLLQAADAVLAETSACDLAAAKAPEDPLATRAKIAAAAEVKKFASSCQSAATTFINLRTVAKTSLLQLLREGIKHVYREHGLQPPTDSQVDELFQTQASSDAAIEDLYVKFYDFYEKERERKAGGTEVGLDVIAQDTTAAVRASIGVALRGHMLRLIQEKWLGNIQDMMNAIKPKNGRCEALAPSRYYPTLFTLFLEAKHSVLQSVDNAPGFIKRYFGDIRQNVGNDFFGGKDEKGNAIPKNVEITVIERQLRAVDELVRRMLELVAKGQSDFDAARQTYVSMEKSVETLEKTGTVFIAATKKAAQRSQEAVARQLAEDAKKQGRIGALARQRQADAQADAKRAAAKMEHDRLERELAKEAIKRAARDVGDEARRDFEALQTARCPSGCSRGKKYQRPGTEVLGTCTNNTVSVAVENIVCCDFGITQVNPDTGKVEYMCTDREPPAFTNYDNVVRVNVGPPGNPGRDQYGSVWCANLPRELRPNECPVPDGQAIADAFCTWSGDSAKASKVTGLEFYRMELEPVQ